MKLPTLFRRPAPVWPGNRDRVADDLREALDHEAVLANQLVAARQAADLADARTAAAERRAAGAERAHQAAADQLLAAHRDLRALRADRAGLRHQLDRALGYDDQQLAAIAAGTGEPTKS